jgi:DNA-binding winged helix-turn-helix (wHTH) protein
MNEAVVHRALCFDRFSLDLMRGCLRAGEQDIELRPKAFEVLRYLLNNAGRLVAKRELHDAIWPNVTVSDDSIKQCIRELRDKLGDSNRSLIKTVPRRGYLLDAAVSVEALHRAGQEQAVIPPQAPWAQLGWRQFVGAIRPHGVVASLALAVTVLGAGWSVALMLSWSPAKLVILPKLAQPRTTGQFDGVWRVDWSNNEHCRVKSATAIWIVREGVIAPGSDKITGTVSSAGKLRYTVPALIDPNLMNVGLATLRGEQGQGKWEGQRGCGGVFTLVRTKSLG